MVDFIASYVSENPDSMALAFQSSYLSISHSQTFSCFIDGALGESGLVEKLVVKLYKMLAYSRCSKGFMNGQWSYIGDASCPKMLACHKWCALSMGFSKISRALFECGLVEVAFGSWFPSWGVRDGVPWQAMSQLRFPEVQGRSAAHMIYQECSTEVCSLHGLSISLFQISTMIIRNKSHALVKEKQQPNNQPNNQTNKQRK